MLNCQSTARCESLTREAQAAISCWSASRWADASVGKTLSGEGTQFTFGNIEPTPMFGGIDKVNAVDIGSSDSGFKDGVESALGMGVEIIHDERNLVAISIAGIQEMGDFQGHSSLVRRSLAVT